MWMREPGWCPGKVSDCPSGGGWMFLEWLQIKRQQCNQKMSVPWLGANLVIVLSPVWVLWECPGHNLIRLAHYFISSRLAPENCAIYSDWTRLETSQRAVMLDKL